jgi:hypothetical protein
MIRLFTCLALLVSVMTIVPMTQASASGESGFRKFFNRGVNSDGDSSQPSDPVHLEPGIASSNGAPSVVEAYDLGKASRNASATTFEDSPVHEEIRLRKLQEAAWAEKLDEERRAQVPIALAEVNRQVAAANAAHEKELALAMARNQKNIADAVRKASQQGPIKYDRATAAALDAATKNMYDQGLFAAPAPGTPAASSSSSSSTSTSNTTETQESKPEDSTSRKSAPRTQRKFYVPAEE